MVEYADMTFMQQEKTALKLSVSSSACLLDVFFFHVVSSKNLENKKCSTQQYNSE